MRIEIGLAGVGPTISLATVPAGADGNVSIVSELLASDFVLLVRNGVLCAIAATAIGTSAPPQTGGGFTLDYSQSDNGLFLFSVL